jgi:hypothetical protein
LRRYPLDASHSLQQPPDIDLVSFDERNLASLRQRRKQTMKRFLATIALACVLSASASAGEVPTSGVTSPQPGEVPTSGVTSPQTGDLIHNGPVVSMILTIIGLLPG